MNKEDKSTPLSFCSSIQIKEKIHHFFSGSFFKFCIVGFLGSVTNLIIFYITSRIFGFSITFASIAAFCVAVTQNYISNHMWSFKSHVTKKPNTKSYYTYVAVNVLSLCLNIIVLHALVSFGFDSVLSQAFGIVSGIVISYTGVRFFVFFQKKK
jgi:putative flippase GtrA